MIPTAVSTTVWRPIPKAQAGLPSVMNPIPVPPTNRWHTTSVFLPVFSVDSDFLGLLAPKIKVQEAKVKSIMILFSLIFLLLGCAHKGPKLYQTSTPNWVKFLRDGTQGLRIEQDNQVMYRANVKGKPKEVGPDELCQQAVQRNI